MRLRSDGGILNWITLLYEFTGESIGDKMKIG